MRTLICTTLAIGALIAAGCSASGNEDDGSSGSAAGGQNSAGSGVGGFGFGGSNTGQGGGFEGCGESAFGNQVSGSLLIVLDKSGSMSEPPTKGGSTSKWQSTVAAINTMVSGANPAIEMGLLPYPAGNFDDAALLLCLTNPMGAGCPAILADSGCTDVAMTPSVTVAPLQQNATAISGWLNSNSPGGNTPTLYGLKNGYDIIKAHPSNGQRFVLLITDGEPTLKNPGFPPLLPASADLCGEFADIESEVSNAAAGAVPVNTFVIGSPGSEGAATFLSQLALNGNTPKDPNCSAGAGNCHYQVGSANFEQELSTVLQDISGQISDCVFELPINENTDPGLVNVTVDTPNGTVTIFKDVDHVDGWDYTDATQTKVQLFGPACELYKAQPGNVVNIILGCPTEIK